MSKRIILLPALLVLLAAVVFTSGCIFDKGTDTTRPEFIPQKNLPAGFTYMGIHETSVDASNFSANATEGVYRTDKGEDMYIQAFKSDNPEALITEYKLRYKDVKYNPFQEISINGHKATRITDYKLVDGKQQPEYSIIWAKGNYMVLVGTSVDASTVMNLASATGY